MAWATIAQFKANQKNLAGAGDPLITLSLNATSSQITSCLASGGYSVSTMQAAVAAGAVYDSLVILNIRLAALDLMAGGGVSSFSGANEKTFAGWMKATQAILDSICSGTAYIENSGTGDDVASINSALVGMVTDSRKMGTDLIDPLLWEDVTPISSDYTATEV